MSPKNRTRISAYFPGPIKLKRTVFPRTSALNISQYCVMKPIRKFLQYDFCSSGIFKWFHDEEASLRGHQDVSVASDDAEKRRIFHEKHYQLVW